MWQPSNRVRYALAALSGLIYAFSFARWDIWPLAFFAYVPFWIALRGVAPKQAWKIGWLAGTVMATTGFYWLQNMLATFSGFPAVVCALFVLVLSSYQGGRLALQAWLGARMSERGWGSTWPMVLSWIAAEFVYPLLFPWYFGATLHTVPVLMQTADLGGPVLVGLLLLGVNLAIYEMLCAKLYGSPLRRKLVIGGFTAFVVAALYGVVRGKQVYAKVESAPSAKVGLVQGNLSLVGKREDPAEGLRRHLQLSHDLKEKGADFVVWSESSVTFPVPEDLADNLMRDRVGRKIGLPSVFGGVIVRRASGAERDRWFNVALAADATGKVTSRYDKQFLLAFGEYLPLGETFPILYDWSPNSGAFSPGKSLEPLHLEINGVERKLGALICYEDILPSFANKLIGHAQPELLVNITNDAWFGDTAEPWQHLALAKLRSIEHRRYLVRTTNSGVSAVVDPFGKLMSNTQTFVPATLLEAIHWMNGSTVYEFVGDTAWYLAALAAFVLSFKRRQAPTPAPTSEISA